MNAEQRHEMAKHLFALRNVPESGLELDARFADMCVYIDSLLAAEREAMAKICEELFVDHGYHPMLRNGAFNCAAAIRAKGDRE